MLDFVKVSTRTTKRGTIEVFPRFVVKKSFDLMIRGGDFYAIWDEKAGLWSTDEYRAIELIDEEIERYYTDLSKNSQDRLVPLYLWDSSSRSIDEWHHFVQKQCKDSYHSLDDTLVWSNDPINKKDYSSKRLKYPLEPGSIAAYEEMMATLYSEEERHKLEWAIGAIVSGDSKKIQKFEVIYGSAGTGKSTVLNIIQMLFDGYYTVFDAKSLGSANSSFALEPFRTNPLIAIQHDGDLSRIEDNTRLNSVVSHEEMTVNEKFTKAYTNRFNCFLFMGTNKPVRITDSKSGIIRRLIDVSPTGDKIPSKRYNELYSQIKFELGAIASHCKDVYLENPSYYDSYVPTTMLGASNDFYNYILDEYETFKSSDTVTLKAAWESYKRYCEDAKVPYPFSQRVFKEELKSYFNDFHERDRTEDGLCVRNLYLGFKSEKFSYVEEKTEKKVQTGLKFDSEVSLLDEVLAGYPAQYASESGTPQKKWANVNTTLKDIDTTKLHYVKVPENHIVIDFDLKNKEGEKSYKKNLEAASKWPPTYAELSKSGSGIHLHYIYDGDVSKLANLYEEGIEIKVFTGNSALRRKISKCNALPVRTINSGLPLKGDTKVVDFESVKNEKAIRTLITKNLHKEIHDSTKCSIDFIYKILEDAYKAGINYDVTSMRPSVMAFAAESTHNSDYCLKLVSKMHFKCDISEEKAKEDYPNDILVFFDVEVFPNLFVVVYKAEGKSPVKLINPSSLDIENMLRWRLVGFNNRRYDNHILYARWMGYSNEQLYNLSQKLINTEKGDGANCFFGEAYNLSYTDIYDFSSKKQSLKKFEIELGIHHQELGLPWDEPVDKKNWELVADYCVNDVVATEAVFNARKGDWTARQILADVAGMSVNDTTNSLTTRIIFGKNKSPQSEFRYRDLSKPVKSVDPEMREFLDKYSPMDKIFIGSDGNKSALPYFPGYTYTTENGKRESVYRDEVVGEGGYVYSKPGMYWNVRTYDVASEHPHSITSEYLFGPYTQNFQELMDARVAIKHKDFASAKNLLGGKLSKYLDDPSNAKALSQALKIAINSVYGLTAASFMNPFHDIRNVDNIVAKRGALFMVDLRHAIEEAGFTVIHCKTDSIKVVNPSPAIEDFIFNFGHRYGYDFEIEHIFEKICLVNDAVYIAKLDINDPDWVSECAKAEQEGRKEPTRWTATGTQFSVPFVFKTLFSGEPIEFGDLCETKTVNTALYLDFNENLDENGHDYRFVGKAGLFCPIKEGSSGGLLLRKNKSGEGYSAVTGTKGYRWMESEIVHNLGKEDAIDITYYDKMADEAIKTISEFGDFKIFASDEPGYEFMNIPEGAPESGVPF